MIHKYELSATEPTTIKIRSNWEVLSIANQRERAVVWIDACHDDDATEASVEFVPVVTGSNPPESYKFIGTVLLHGGNYVAHYFLKFNTQWSPLP